MKTFLKIIATIIVLSILFSILVLHYLGSVNKSDEKIIFVIPQNIGSFNLTDSLFEHNLIKNKNGFDFLKNNFFKNIKIKSGGYELSQKLNSWQALKKISNEQDLFWVNIYFCPRKEQVGEQLANILGWNENQIATWNNLYKKSNTDYFEGVYYPDTYLIPKNESVEEVAQRFINRFNEKFSPLSNQFTSKNIKWTTGLKIASLIAREAGGRDDAKIISGVIWNRLNQDMRLQIDATMQYTLGKNEKGSWWGNVSLEEKQSDSPYNSYKNTGLPPTPICSPNIEYIEAALNPEDTDCIFYLHDSSRQIHCAKTYTEHKANIVKYLN